MKGLLHPGGDRSAGIALERARLESDAYALVWRVLERFDQIPTSSQVNQAVAKIVASFDFLQELFSAEETLPPLRDDLK